MTEVETLQVKLSEEIVAKELKNYEYGKLKAETQQSNEQAKLTIESLQ